MNKTSTFIALVLALTTGFLISAKKQEPQNPVYEYLYIVERGFTWEITSKDTVEYIQKDRDYNRKYVQTNKEKEFITETVNRYERKGYELFSYGIYESTVLDNNPLDRQYDYHSILMRKKRPTHE